MPATGGGAVSISSGDAVATEFDPGAPAPGRAHDPPLTVEQIKATISWMSAENSAAYQECVRSAVRNDHHYRGWAAYFGALKRPEHEKEMTSGSGVGAVIWHTDERFGPQYGAFSVEGEHAVLFSNSYSDDDDNPRNVYSSTVATARPLPAGTYTFTSVGVNGHYIACNYTPREGYGGRLYWTITVTAPDGALHEAFFDSVTVGTAVGANGKNGTLSPTDFTAGDKSVSLWELKWDGGKVTLTMSTHNPLTGHVLEFIALDGTIALTLDAASATSDTTAGTLSWPVVSQPWSDGDQLMLRIRYKDIASGDVASGAVDTSGDK